MSAWLIKGIKFALEFEARAADEHVVNIHSQQERKGANILDVDVVHNVFDAKPAARSGGFIGEGVPQAT